MPPSSPSADAPAPKGKRARRRKSSEEEGGKPSSAKPKRRKSAANDRSGSKKKSGGSRGTPRQLHGPSLFDALTRRNALLLWFGALLLLLAICFYPVADGATRSLTLILSAGLALGLLALWWRYPLLRWSLIALYLLLIGYWFLPGRTTFDRPLLRDETARALARYEGATFWPDGENRLGIDGPGLIRRGIIEGTFRHGLRTLNPWLLRRSFTFWSSDLTARELVPHAKGTARRYTVVKSLRELNPAVLYPGDFIVTEDRQHVLSYLGDGRWLWPNREAGKVVILQMQTATGPIAEMPVSLMRWRILEAPRPINR